MELSSKKYQFYRSSTKWSCFLSAIWIKKRTHKYSENGVNMDWPHSVLLCKDFDIKLEIWSKDNLTAFQWV